MIRKRSVLLVMDRVDGTVTVLRIYRSRLHSGSNQCNVLRRGAIFFGVIASQGIRRIALVASNGGIEADQLQYGAQKE